MKNSFIIFGATGDLMQRKIAPSLLGLNSYFPDHLTEIYGFGRREYDDNQFRSFLSEAIEQKLPNEEHLGEFLKKIFYHQGLFDDIESYKNLKEKLGINVKKYFYLAVPQSLYSLIISNLKESGLIDDNTKIILEKPIGFDFSSSIEFEDLLNTSFKEENVFRLDHYFGKEIVNNILYFRKENPLFEDSWNGKSIESIQITLNEDLGVENRGEFYDALGAFRDMGQSHVLNILSIILMNIPQTLTSKTIIDERLRVLNSLRSLNAENIRQSTFRAQYKGYREIQGVKEDSLTETYFRIKFFVDLKGWEETPIYAESGKRIGANDKFVCINFKGGNKLQFRAAPKKTIFLSTKNILQKGLDYNLEEIDFESKYPADNLPQYIGEYTKLFNEVINDNKEFFLSREESLAAWRFTDSLVKNWQESDIPLHSYDPGDSSIVNQSRLFIN